MSAPHTSDENPNPQAVHPPWREFRLPASVTLLDEACCLVLRQMIAHLTTSPNDDESRRHLEANVKLVKDMAAPVAVSLRAARMLAPPRTRSTAAADRETSSGYETAVDRLTGPRGTDDDPRSRADSNPNKPAGKMGEISQEALDRLHRKYPDCPREHIALLRRAAMDIYGPDFMTDIDVAKAYNRPPPPAPEERHRPADNPRATRADPACGD